MNTGKLFPAFLQSYFCYLFVHFLLFFLRLPSWSDIFSADNKEFDKSKITKNKVECYHCRYILPIPVYCIGRHLRKPTICEQYKIDQQNSIAEISKNHQFPEKTDIGTVKMVKDHCEATVR